MDKKKKESIKAITSFIMGLFLIGLMLWVAWNFVAKPLVEEDKAMDNFCIKEGYEKMTDFKYPSRNSGGYGVECDSEEIFEVIKKKDCLEYNKWGDCKDYEIKYCEYFYGC